MEEVWKEINPASLKEITYCASSSYSSTTANSNSFFQQFLSSSSQPFRTNILHSSSSSSAAISAAASDAVTVTAKGASSHTLPNSSAKLLMPCLRNKRPFPEPPRPTSPDIRSKRLIKNRESAARSRARKQAYTYELEIKLADLRRENARLIRQLEQFDHTTGAGNQHKMKNQNTLYRTTTAPF